MEAAEIGRRNAAARAAAEAEAAREVDEDAQELFGLVEMARLELEEECRAEEAEGVGGPATGGVDPAATGAAAQAQAIAQAAAAAAFAPPVVEASSPFGTDTFGSSADVAPYGSAAPDAFACAAYPSADAYPSAGEGYDYPPPDAYAAAAAAAEGYGVEFGPVATDAGFPPNSLRLPPGVSQPHWGAPTHQPTHGPFTAMGGVGGGLDSGPSQHQPTRGPFTAPLGLTRASLGVGGGRLDGAHAHAHQPTLGPFGLNSLGVGGGLHEGDVGEDTMDATTASGLVVKAARIRAALGLSDTSIPLLLEQAGNTIGLRPAGGLMQQANALSRALFGE